MLAVGLGAGLFLAGRWLSQALPTEARDTRMHRIILVSVCPVVLVAAWELSAMWRVWNLLGESGVLHHLPERTWAVVILGAAASYGALSTRFLHEWGLGRAHVVSAALVLAAVVVLSIGLPLLDSIIGFLTW